MLHALEEILWMETMEDTFHYQALGITSMVTTRQVFLMVNGLNASYLFIVKS